ncbi:MAG: ABC transporter ATP-binding protein [Algiphilus sp.]
MHLESDAPVADPVIRVDGLTMAFGQTVVQRNIDCAIPRTSIFAIIGGSGCGKSTLLRHMIGLETPHAGRIERRGRDGGEPRFGVMFQHGALWSSMTLAENIETAVAFERQLTPQAARELARYKLALVGLARYADYYPAAISGGMRKRAAIARALALDPELVFLDEPSAGLDPLSASALDELILQLRDTLQTSIVLVTHELHSIFAIVDQALFLDAEQKTPSALGSPRWLAESCPVAGVRRFMHRASAPAGASA